MKTTYPPNGQQIPIDPLQLAQLCLKASKLIDVRYFLGTAQHESDFVCNCDTEEDDDVHSLGLFQVNSDEAKQAGYNPKSLDLLSPQDNLAVFVRISEQRLDAILKEIGYPSPEPEDLRAYLFLSHNQGLGAAIKSIQMYGLNWGNGDSSYKARNVQHRSWLAYGDDVISGGRYYPEIARTLGL